MVAVLGLVVLLVAGGLDGPRAQVAPKPEPRSAPRPQTPRPAPPPPANICTTQWGWCQLPTVTAPVGVACVCLTVHHQQVPGSTRYFPYEGTASPYLQPHVGPPTTIR